MSGAAARVVFSGIQPTGRLHLGNYVGAVTQWLRLQDDRNTRLLVSVVDAHALTLGMPSGARLRQDVRAMAATLIACGLTGNGHDTVLFVQSAVPAHFKLSWLCACVSTLAQLQRQPQYKDKAKKYSKYNNVPTSLLTYPLLQAADILLYNASHVPVGEDQRQHVELARDIVRTLNLRSKQSLFVEPQLLTSTAPRVRSLRNPMVKMSKSDKDPRACLNICDSEEVVVDKFKKALTDFTSAVTYEPETRPAVSNLISIHAVFSGKTTEQIVDEAKGLTTAQYKLRIADEYIETFRPVAIALLIAQSNDTVRKRYEKLMQEPQHVDALLRAGAEAASEMADKNMRRICDAFGLQH